MSIYIVKPSLTDEFIIRIFDYLCIAEVKRRVGISPQLHEGQQDGYVVCLTDLLGQVDDDESERAFDNGKSYLHVINRVVSDKLSEHIEEMLEVCKDGIYGIEQIDKINNTVKNAVREYNIEHPEEFVEAIKCL